MSSTLLEVTRSANEDVERLERLVVKELQHDPAPGKERILQNHRIRIMIDNIIGTTDKLVDIYEDKDNARRDEIAALGGQNSSSLFGAFYDRLKEIREYHRRHPAARVVDAGEEYEEVLKEEPHVEFSGEESFGRYLDMHELYNVYINSKFGGRIEYSAYLKIFPQFHKTSHNLKLTRQYRDYLTHLLEYLISFFERKEPLQDVGQIFSKVETDFEDNWAEGKVLGWEYSENGNASSQELVIDLDYYSTVEELIGVEPEKLKEALAARGLKAGGTIQQRAERLFLTKMARFAIKNNSLVEVVLFPNDHIRTELVGGGIPNKHTPLEQLDRKHFAKGKRNGEQNGDVVSQANSSEKEIALMEAKIRDLCNRLEEVIQQTIENDEKKQVLTYEERLMDREEIEEEPDVDSSDDDQEIYNPLKLPMGWDGKPIPYWLYKLHGLGQEFKCEICGNHSYWGRRAFERHFKEWRHQHGMRCLGIPNTKNFNEVTSIEEAKELWKRIQLMQGQNKWRPDEEEEYEDREGNIYNKKTYTDLQRQGLI